MAVYNRWTGLVDWTSGLDYWTHLFTSENRQNTLFRLLSNPQTIDRCKQRPANTHTAHNRVPLRGKESIDKESPFNKVVQLHR